MRAGPTFLFDDQAPFLEIIQAVEAELARVNGFLRDSPVILHFGNRVLSRAEWWRLKDLFLRERLLLRYAVSSQAVSRDLLYREGLPVRDDPVAAATESQAARTTQEEGGSLYLRRGLRSGQKQTFEGDLIVTGDVNRGAEIVAGGDVLVFGHLRGLVHAGYPENKHAVVIALNLVPVQLRIGPLFARPEEEQSRTHAPHPEVASVRNEYIVIEPYKGKR